MDVSCSNNQLARDSDQCRPIKLIGVFAAGKRGSCAAIGTKPL
jgi:hypothetical protein